MKILKYGKYYIAVISCLLLISCEEFVDVDAPNHKIVSELVFEDEAMVIAAIRGIYNELANADFSKGYLYSISVLAGMSPDIFETTKDTDTRFGPFQQNELTSLASDDATANQNLWSSAYNIIYMTNSVLEGVGNSKTITKETKMMAAGQALFIRAFTYFYLTNLYGDVPLILNTDYRKNSVVPRDAAVIVWEQVEADLEKALLLLADVLEYPDNERIYVNYFAVLALRARVHLYQRNWEKAEELSSQVIGQTSLYEILQNLDQVFLKNSREAIWQISPEGRGTSSTYTWEGYIFRGNNASPIKLAESFLTMLPIEDKRLSHWVGYNDSKDFYFPQKYKDRSSRNNVAEYSMVLRLSEQFLIRAEARAMQGNLSGAMMDLDKIRRRAGLDLLADTRPNINQNALLDMIMNERKLELFSEWGHRWLDLKRTGNGSTVLAPIKPLWQDTDLLYPIPGEERLKNPKLSQNIGY